MKIVTAILLLSISFFAKGQDSVRFASLVADLEASGEPRIFYDASRLDTLMVSKLSSGTAASVLRSALAGTDFKVTSLSDNQIVITYRREIRSELPIGYWEVNNNNPVELDLAALNFDDDLTSGEDEYKSVENKLVNIGARTSIREGEMINLAGYIREAESGEGVIGAMVYIDEPKIGSITDVFGYYNISLPQGRHTLRVRSVGLKETKREVMLYAEGSLDIEMQDDVIALKEVIVEAEKTANIVGMQMGMEKLDIKKIKQVPTVLGEADIVRIALTLPGVTTVGEGSSGFNVRGGAADQNLILINDAMIYNPSHFFGFFSVFNPDVIKSASLMKSGIPAQHGGRVSSVFEVTTRDGNKRKFGVRGGISPVTARITAEGPILKDKTSFIIGARSTYSDWLLQQIPNSTVNNSAASFYDVSGKISHDFGEKDVLNLSSYYSKDRFKLFSDSVIQYSNFNSSAQWKHVFNNKLIGVLTGVYSDYQYNINYEGDSSKAFDMDYRIETIQGKIDFNYFPGSDNKLDFGLSATLYTLNPGDQVPLGQSSVIRPVSLEPEKGLESAIYVGDNFNLTDRLSFYLGLRYSIYQYLGPKTVYGYRQGVPLEERTITDTTTFSKNDVIKTYHGPEYRFSGRYTLNEVSSVKLSYNRMRQYINQLSNTTAVAPTDTWKLSDAYIKPQIGDQVALGYYRNFRSNSIETSVEVYYKTINDVLDYKGGAQLLLNELIETDLLNGFNKSYGAEFLIKKKVGKLDGWISYTYSRSLNQVKSQFPEETINNGDFFPANYDRPHSLNIIGNYKFTRRLNLSGSFVYASGRPITYPVAKYNFRNTERIFYSNRNEFRIPDYIRLDVSVQIEGNHKVDKPAHSSWSVSVYNLLGRRNAYSVYFVSERGEINGYKLSVFGSAIPTITYNFQF